MVLRLRPTLAYGTYLTAHDVWKLLALMTMVIDHLGYYFFDDQTWLRVIGRIAFPIFLFLVGHASTRRQDSAIWLGAAIVAASSFFCGYGLLPFNILLTILATRALLMLAERTGVIRNELAVLWFALLLFYPASTLLMEYGTMGMMFAVIGMLVHDGRRDFTAQIFICLTLVAWLIFEGNALELTPSLMACFTLIAVVQFYFLCRFTPTPATSHRKAPEWVLFASRHTLILYVLHVVAFQLSASLITHSNGAGFGEFLLQRPVHQP